jgi:hypothetical protein
VVVDEGLVDGEPLLHLLPHHLNLFTNLLQHLLHEKLDVRLHGARFLLEMSVVLVCIQINIAGPMNLIPGIRVAIEGSRGVGNREEEEIVGTR